MLLPPPADMREGLLGRACSWVAARRPARGALVGTLRPVQRARVLAWYRDSVEPALTPTAIDASHPLPRLDGGSRHLLVVLRSEGEAGRRQALVRLPGPDRHVDLRVGLARLRIQAAALVAGEVGRLFRGRRVLTVVPFTVVEAHVPSDARWTRRSDRPRQRLRVAAAADDVQILHDALGELVALEPVETTETIA